MTIKIEVETKTYIRFCLVVLGFVFAIFAIYNAMTALIILGTAFFLALALNAPVSWLAKHLPGKSRVIGTAIAYLMVLLLLGAFIFFVVPPIVQQTAKFIDTLPNLIENATTQWHGLRNLIDKYHLQPQVDSAIAAAQNSSVGWATSVSQNVVSSLGSLLSIVTSGILVVVLSFLMLVEGPMWLKRLWGLYNDEERMESHRKLVDRMYSVVTGYVSGQLIVSAIGGLSSGAVVFILSRFINQVPANLSLPTVAIAFTLSLIPMFGATIAGVLISLLLAFNDVSAAIIFAVFFVLYQQVENNFISPHIQSKRVELSALTILASVTIGLYVFGLAGGIIAIPIAGCLRVLLEAYLERAKRNRRRSRNPIAKLAKMTKPPELS